MSTCLTCGFPIFPMNQAVGYAGPVCGCVLPRPASERDSTLGFHLKIKELETQLKMKIDDWISACKEIDVLKEKQIILVEALKDIAELSIMPNKPFIAIDALKKAGLNE